MMTVRSVPFLTAPLAVARRLARTFVSLDVIRVPTTRSQTTRCLCPRLPWAPLSTPLFPRIKGSMSCNAAGRGCSSKELRLRWHSSDHATLLITPPCPGSTASGTPLCRNQTGTSWSFEQDARKRLSHDSARSTMSLMCPQDARVASWEQRAGSGATPPALTPAVHRRRRRADECHPSDPNRG